MAVQLIKPAISADGSAAAKPIKIKIKSTIDLKADNMVATYTEMRKAQKLIKEYDEDRKFLVDYVDKIAGDDDEAVITAEGGAVRISKKINQQAVISMSALHQKIGDENFYSICKVSVEDLKMYMSGQDLEEHIKTEPTGGRRAIVTLNSTPV